MSKIRYNVRVAVERHTQHKNHAKTAKRDTAKGRCKRDNTWAQHYLCVCSERSVRFHTKHERLLETSVVRGGEGKYIVLCISTRTLILSVQRLAACTRAVKPPPFSRNLQTQLRWERSLGTVAAACTRSKTAFVSEAKRSANPTHIAPNQQ